LIILLFALRFDAFLVKNDMLFLLRLRSETEG